MSPEKCSNHEDFPAGSQAHGQRYKTCCSEKKKLFHLCRIRGSFIANLFWDIILLIKWLTVSNGKQDWIAGKPIKCPTAVWSWSTHPTPFIPQLCHQLCFMFIARINTSRLCLKGGPHVLHKYYLMTIITSQPPPSLGSSVTGNLLIFGTRWCGQNNFDRNCSWNSNNCLVYSGGSVHNTGAQSEIRRQWKPYRGVKKNKTIQDLKV